MRIAVYFETFFLEQPQYASGTSGSKKVRPAANGSNDPNMYTPFMLGPAITIQAHVRADFSAVWPGSGRDVRNNFFYLLVPDSSAPTGQN